MSFSEWMRHRALAFVADGPFEPEAPAISDDADFPRD
jgi:hypothetical protein